MKNLENEIWKEIDEYMGAYSVSNLGRIRSNIRIIYKNGGSFVADETLMKPMSDKDGYVKIGLRIDNKQRNFFVHRLVSIAFIPNPESKPQVNHINGIKNDNRVENLEWCTKSQNELHAYRTGLKSAKGNRSGKLTDIQVLEIRRVHTESPRTPIAETANRFNVSQSLVSMIKNRKIWTHL